jgi:nicotinamidase-related amidase
VKGRFSVAGTPGWVVIDVQQGLIQGFEDDWRQVLPVISGLALLRDAGVTRVMIVGAQTEYCVAGAPQPVRLTWS